MRRDTFKGHWGAADNGSILNCTYFRIAIRHTSAHLNDSSPTVHCVRGYWFGPRIFMPCTSRIEAESYIFDWIRLLSCNARSMSYVFVFLHLVFHESSDACVCLPVMELLPSSGAVFERPRTPFTQASLRLRVPLLVQVELLLNHSSDRAT